MKHLRIEIALILRVKPISKISFLSFYFYLDINQKNTSEDCFFQLVKTLGNIYLETPKNTHKAHSYFYFTCFIGFGRVPNAILKQNNFLLVTPPNIRQMFFFLLYFGPTPYQERFSPIKRQLNRVTEK